MSPISTTRRTKPYASYSPRTTTRSAIAKRAAARLSAAIKIQSMFRRKMKSQGIKRSLKLSKALLDKIRFARVAKYYPYLSGSK
jgi:hypothetical protein